jgi:hypothetical protein
MNSIHFGQSAIHFNVIVVSCRNRRAIFTFRRPHNSSRDKSPLHIFLATTIKEWQGSTLCQYSGPVYVYVWRRVRRAFQSPEPGGLEKLFLVRTISC